MSDSVLPHRRQPTRPCLPWDSPGKNTGVGCHFLLQCMKVKSESEFAQSCPTLSDPMDCSLPGSSVHGIFQARVLEWFAIAFSKEVSRCFKKRMRKRREKGVSRGSVGVGHGLSCPVACGIFLDQGSNPCPLHWQADSQPLDQQGSLVGCCLWGRTESDTTEVT